MSEPPLADAGQVAAVRAAVRECNPDATVIAAVLRPHPVEPPQPKHCLKRIAVTPYSTLNKELGFGLETKFHVVPSQCSMSV